MVPDTVKSFCLGKSVHLDPSPPDGGECQGEGEIDEDIGSGSKRMPEKPYTLSAIPG